MSSNEDRVREVLADQAAAWFVANREAPGAAESEEFLQWLRNSPMHVEEYLGVTQVARDLMACAPQDESATDALVERALREADSVVRPLDVRAHAAPRAASGALAGAGGGGSAGRGNRCRNTRVAAHRALAERGDGHGAAHPDTPRRATHRRLGDSSVLRLNTDSAVVVRYDANERRVTILRGEVNFEVTHELRRPFKVLAGVAEIIDRGTVFDVRLT